MNIPGYIVNLPSRLERKAFATKEFTGREEFDFKIEEATAHETGAISLWLTLQKIVHRAEESKCEYFIFCEDDHQFTSHYNFQILQQCIQEAQALDADILSGGVSWFQTGVQVSKKLFWVEKFSGLQFTVIFKKIYQKILEVANFTEHDAADYKISELTDKKFVIYPFISIQKDFGYSDVTVKNNMTGRVEALFEDASENLAMLKKVRSFYFPDFA